MGQVLNKFGNFKSKLPQDRGRLFVLIIIALVIPITVALGLTTQELRSRAGGEGVTPASPPATSPNTTTPTLTPYPNRSNPLGAMYLAGGITVNDYTQSVSVSPGQSVKLMSLNSTGATSFCFYGPPTSVLQGLNVNPSSGGLVNGDNRDIYITVADSIAPGVYSGNPKIIVNCSGQQNILPEIKVYVGIPLPTPTNLPAAILRFNSVKLHGIGSGGDNTNPNLLGNLDPQRKGRILTVEVTDAAGNTYVPESGNIVYDSVSRDFSGDITLNPDTIYDGNFIIKVKSPQYLKKQIPGIIAFKNNGIVQVGSISLTTGDINNDNSLSLADYTILIDCYADLLPAKNCSDTAKKQSADISDDGKVNQDDYNLFLRELSVISGN